MSAIQEGELSRKLAITVSDDAVRVTCICLKKDALVCRAPLLNAQV